MFSAKIVYVGLYLVGLLTVTFAVPLRERRELRKFFDDMVEKGFIKEIDYTYKYTPEEMGALSKQLSLSPDDYGPYFTDRTPVKVSRMAGSGEYGGHKKANLVIKTFPVNYSAAALGEIKALELMGDLVDFGKNSKGDPVIIMRRKEGTRLNDIKAYHDANTENKRQMVKETGNLACAKAASDAVHKGVWHNDQHLGNILVTEVKDGSVKSIELIDYGEINNYLVYDDGRNPDHESKFYEYCQFYWDWYFNNTL
ncbi:hypothetical protein F5890DRAFT_1490409 [Lentinula detonsa]|uniref:ABC1 atypical kinase-like domain-containing protein n=1 Tax=Lentinula detonsa TaxID=2804962 RepID=A0AA38Q8K6_9AGAR|nr:hypothetical protein F5890DRAFT_1490409 [Lentinula detonsa]